MAKYPGLTRRGTRWYVRVVVPIDLVKKLGKKQILRSLKTGHHAEARRLYSKFKNRIEQEFAEAREGDRKLTRSEARQCTVEWFRECIRCSAENDQTVFGPDLDDIFCKIVKREAPAHRVFEDDRTLAFMDIFPVAEGHTLIIPKAHATNLLEAQVSDLALVIAHSRRVAHAIREVLAPDGIGVFQLNGAAAGQTIFHYHMHLIPRMKDAALRIHSRTPGDPDRLAETARRLAAAVPAS